MERTRSTTYGHTYLKCWVSQTTARLTEYRPTPAATGWSLLRPEYGGRQGPTPTTLGPSYTAPTSVVGLYTRIALAGFTSARSRTLPRQTPPSCARSTTATPGKSGIPASA